MAINKRKILESAQKHLQRGALDKALEDYRSLLKADPHDCNVLLKVGDLCLKQGKRDEAINSYLRVAQQFTREGFDAKAVALYKQISRLDPKRHDVCVPLSELYARMGLVSDAIAALQGAADAAYRAGDKDAALELLRRMASLDPANTSNRLKVADLLAQEGHRPEALSEYEAVAEELARRGEDEERVRVLERMLVADPERVSALREVARAKLTAKQFGAARKLAERLVAVQADDLDGREILGHALLGEGDEDAAQTTFRALAELYRLRGDEGRARDLVQRFGGLDSLAPDGSDARGDSDVPVLDLEAPIDDFLLDEVPALQAPPEPPRATVLAPEPPPASEATAPAAEPETVDPDQLMAEATVYLRYGKNERAVAALRNVLAQVPGHGAALESLGEALLASGEPAHAVTAWQRAADSARDAGDDETIARIRERLSAVDEEAAAALAPVQHDEPEIEIDLDLGSSLESIDDPTLAAGTGIESLAIDLEGVEEFSDSEALPAPEPEPALETSAADQPLGTETAEPVEEPTATTPARVAEDLEEAEFYFEQGLHDEARALYERILEAAPNHPQALLRLGEIAARSGAPPPVPPVPTQPAPMAVRAIEPEFVEEPDLEPAPAAALPEYELELEFSEPPTIDTKLRHEEAPLAAQAEVTTPGIEEPVAPVQEPGDFDLAAELSDAIESDEPSVRTLAGTEEEGFDEVFQAFKTGVERELGEGDHEARYDLGIAYKEMGLLEDAIAAFQLAMLAPGRELASLHMMGLCALELGRGADAVAHLEQALSLPDLPEDKRIPLRYDAGRAYAGAGDIARARAAFEEVRAADPGFGDIESELAALDALRSEDPETEEQTDDETYASFDDQLAEPVRATAEAPRYESFEDLFNDESEEAEVSTPSATLDAAEPEPVPAEPEFAAQPEPEPEPDPTPVEPVAPKRRRKISFV